MPSSLATVYATTLARLAAGGREDPSGSPSGRRSRPYLTGSDPATSGAKLDPEAR
jgi:hypothetical protein